MQAAQAQTQQKRGGQQPLNQTQIVNHDARNRFNQKLFNNFAHEPPQSAYPMENKAQP